MNNIINNLIESSSSGGSINDDGNINNNGSTSINLVSSLNSFVVSDSKKRNSNYWNNNNTKETASEMTGSSSNRDDTDSTTTVLWTANRPSFCPTTTTTNDGDVVINSNNNNNNNNNTSQIIQIRQSMKYPNKIAIVTMVLGQRKFLEKRLGLWIQSIRRRGSWLGPIILFVSNNQTINYYNNQQPNFTTSDYKNNVYWFLVTDDMIHHTTINKPFMKYKRFKTQFFDLISSSSSLPVSNIEYIHYMDADILVGNSLVEFWDRTIFYRNDDNNNSDGDNGREPYYPWYFFLEQGKHPAMFRAKDENWTLYHTGVSIWHRKYSQNCLYQWQQRFDSDTFDTDQAALMDVLYNNNSNTTTTSSDKSEGGSCRVGVFPNQDLMMPNIGPMKNGKRATFVHFTHGRLKRISHHMNKFEQCVLLLDNTYINNSE